MLVIKLVCFLHFFHVYWTVVQKWCFTGISDTGPVIGLWLGAVLDAHCKSWDSNLAVLAFLWKIVQSWNREIGMISSVWWKQTPQILYCFNGSYVSGWYAVRPAHYWWYCCCCLLWSSYRSCPVFMWDVGAWSSIPTLGGIMQLCLVSKQEEYCDGELILCAVLRCAVNK